MIAVTRDDMVAAMRSAFEARAVGLAPPREEWLRELGFDVEAVYAEAEEWARHVLAERRASVAPPILIATACVSIGFELGVRSEQVRQERVA